MSPESNLGHYKLVQGGCFHRCASHGQTLPLHSASLAPLFIDIEYLPSGAVTTVGTMTDPETTSMKTVDAQFCMPLLNKDNAKNGIWCFSVFCWGKTVPSWFASSTFSHSYEIGWKQKIAHAVIFENPTESAVRLGKQSSVKWRLDSAPEITVSHQTLSDLISKLSYSYFRTCL